jgi:hypothetical protein
LSPQIVPVEFDITTDERTGKLQAQSVRLI